ncbi:hypothetical protein [Streptomyces vietnamensis]|uniref:hypothetical protein n=1 Tax=Streptomyces vietnamensis TaxID=362257 RepID=UPI00341C0701
MGRHFTLQVHRLSSLGSGAVNPVIRERYGRFARRLRYGKLERVLAGRGAHMEDVPDPNGPAYTLHWQPDSQVSVPACRAARGRHGRRGGGERIGDVYAVYSSTSAEQVAFYRARYGGPCAEGGRG